MNPHEAYFRSLPREDVQLIALREILYDGCWEEMIKDLEARKEGKPFVFKLQTRLEEDLQRIDKMRFYEAEHRVNFGAFLQQKDPAGGAKSR